ncbi:MAG: hypothetical protein GHCLOJNM_03508 [bacterium]|nr:hypothetical protein [bacterium]
MALLQATFLIRTLPAWSGDLGKRLAKAPKVLFCDTGLLCHLLGVTDEAPAREGNLLGPIVENFVAMEVIKQISWSRTRPQMFCFRTHSGEEVDLVLEDSRGRIVGIEIKAKDSLRPEDQRGLRSYSECLGDRFHLGVLLYRGSETIPLGKRLIAMPISALWTG